MNKKETDIICATWEEADAFLYKMAELKAEKDKLEGELTVKVNEIKLQYDAKSKGIEKAYKDYEKAIEVFADKNRDEFIKTRSKDLFFGTVAFRVVSKINIRSIEACITSLKALNRYDCISVKETPNKEQMAHLDAATLAKCGASLKTEDKIRIEPNIEKIKTAG